METVNLISAENLEGRIDVAAAVGSTGTLMFVYDVAPGESQSPYHYEFDEEWLLVVEGSLVLRTEAGEQTLERGDMVCFPAGPTGAHQLTNRTDSPARTLMFSHMRGAAGVSVYPDTDMIGVFPGDGQNDLVFKRGTAVPWSATLDPAD